MGGGQKRPNAVRDASDLGLLGGSGEVTTNCRFSGRVPAVVFANGRGRLDVRDEGVVVVAGGQVLAVLDGDASVTHQLRVCIGQLHEFTGVTDVTDAEMYVNVRPA